MKCFMKESHRDIFCLLLTLSHTFFCCDLLQEKQAPMSPKVWKVFCGAWSAKHCLMWPRHWVQRKGGQTSSMEGHNRSRAYHPQSQGKCKRSHTEELNKIHFKMRQQEGFNWVPKSLSDPRSYQLCSQRSAWEQVTCWSIFKQRQCLIVSRSQRNIPTFKPAYKKSISRRIWTSVYRKGEKVLIRYPPRGGSRLAPWQRYTCKGVVEERKLAQNKYKVRFERPDGKMDSQWISVSDITSVTAQKEKQQLRED